MNLFPTSVGTRPRLACEIRPEGVVAARGESPSGTLTAVSREALQPGAVLPGLKAGNLPERKVIVGALRRAFDSLADRGTDRSRYATIIVPDAAVRVLLLDFDALPPKPAEALQVVRFRLKKLLPFDVDHALVSFQIMSTERSLLRVLAVAIPQEVLAEYESVVVEAGMQPGVVLPSTLAALAGVDPTIPDVLLLNASPAAFTTAILRSGVLLLHRTIEVYPAEAGSFEATPPSAVIATAAAALEEPLSPEETPYLDLGTNALQPDDPSVPALLSPQDPSLRLAGLAFVDRADTAEEWSRPEPDHAYPAIAVRDLNTAPDVGNRNRDLSESVSVAAAYFEDTLGTPPEVLLSAGTTSARDLERTLVAGGLEGLQVRELLSSEAFGPGAATSRLPPGWLAGVRGALRS